MEPDKGTADEPERDNPTWATYTPPETAAPAEPPTPTSTPGPNIYGPPQTSSPEVARLFGTKPRSNTGCLVIPLLVVMLAVGGIFFGVVQGMRGPDEPEDPFGFELDEPSFELPDLEPPPPPPQLHTVRGFNELRDALRAETGTTEVFEITLYPGYATMGVPAEATGQRSFSFYYNGELAEQGKGRSGYERFDLVDIDPRVMGRLVQKAKRLVEDPTSWYVIIRKPGPPFDDGGWFSVYASNEFSESGYLQATLDGEIVKRQVSE